MTTACPRASRRVVASLVLLAGPVVLGGLGCRPEVEAPAGGALLAGTAVEVSGPGRPVALAAQGGSWLLVWSHAGLELRESRDGGGSWSTEVHLPEAVSYAFHPEAGDHHFLVRRQDEVRHLRLAPGEEPLLSGPVFSRRVSLSPPALRGRTEVGVAGLESAGGFLQLVFARSQDHGRSWEPPRPVPASRRLGEPYGVHTLLGARAGWVLAWSDSRVRTTLFDIWTSSSRDGTSWSAARRANDDGEYAWQIDPALVETEEGALVAFMDWREEDPSWDRLQNVYAAPLSGRNLEPRKNVRINTPSTANQGPLTLARQLVGNRVAAVWLDQRHRLTGDIYAAVTRDGGRSWEGENCLSCDRTPARSTNMVASPLLTATRDGFLVAWEEVWGGERAVVLRPFRWVAGETAAKVSAESRAPEQPPPSRIDGRAELVGDWSFEAPGMPGWRPLNGSWLVRGGELLGFGASPALLSWDGEPLTDFVLEGRFRLDPHLYDTVHWFFRAETSDRQAVSGWVVSGHFRRGFLARRLEGPFTASWDDPVYTLADHAFPLRQGVWYPFRLEVLGERMAFWLGEEPILSLSRLTTGPGAGLLLGTNAPPVAFDELRLSRLEPSAPAALPSAEGPSALER